ncbi:Aspartate beta-hydroxylase domain-containing protein 2 [Chionoecetes opilio]|uniref:Aspartate beta-hydroxylase domain-containing protein 2 n=1 Tax=Chionoecetes opilio TaxID=41210 RepID=A0A8J4Y3G6_CHIOP|nr:Aspartate beta-hydroxylase domain-containing protein 2 [Chionoecetes opilio]
MGLLECCSAFLHHLPDPSLPLLPALLFGTIFASLLLLYFYKKETNLPLGGIILHMIRSVFFHLPSNECPADHSKVEQCDNLQCVRCQRNVELRKQIGERWRAWKRRQEPEHLERVEQSMSRLDRRAGNGTIADDDIREEESKERNDQGDTERKLKYRGKFKKDHEKTSFLDKNEGGMRDQKEEGEARGEKGKTQHKEHKQHGNGKTEDKQNIQSNQKPTLFHMELPANPSWDQYDIHANELNLLKLNFEMILQEYEKVFKRLQCGDATGWKNNSLPQGHWCIFPLVDQGRIVTSNCRDCPGVAELVLGCLPAMMNDCVFGNAAFSILYPDSHITAHHGPTNLRLRCHLGLKVPPGCWLEVAGQQYRWAVGETLLFDDSFTHSAHFTNQPSNVHSEPRAVLLLDFWHPDVSAKEKECLLDLLAPLDEA